MKGKILSLFLCMILVVTTVLAGCSKSQTTAPTDENKDSTTAGNTIETAKTEAEPEVEPSNPYRDIYNKYVEDGDFSDFTDFGLEIKADDVLSGADDLNIGFICNGWYITVSTVKALEDKSLIGVGSPDNLNDDTVFVKRVYVAPNTGNTVKCLDNGADIELAVLDLLPDVINYCINNPYSETASPVDGYEWVSYADIYDELWN